MRLNPSRDSLDVPKLLFLTSIMMAVFLYGTAVGRYNIFPFSMIQFAWGSVNQVFQERDTILGLRPTLLLEEARHGGDGVTLFKQDAATPGLTLLGGFFDEDLGFRLIRLDGTIVNRWPARFHEIFPDPSHVKPADRIPQTDWNAGVQGSRVFPDGSLVFNFEGLGLVKLDRCGAVQWTLPQMTHHSVDLAEGGGFWVPGTRYVDGPSVHPGIAPPYDEDTILKVSPDGKILQEISVLSLFFENRLEYLLFANGLENIEVPEKQNLTHLNDIEELKSDMAAHFPEFAAGDLLVSLRNYNLVMVVDPRTHKVKWYQTGPWLKQHDPDFRPNGTISVFNNRSDGTETGSILGGSNIMEVDPRSGSTRVRYGNKPNQKLFTKFRGKHQWLDKGHLLITEAHAGRVFEIDAQGRTVWEYVDRYDEENVAIIAGAIRYPERYFTVKDWRCN